MKEQEGSGSRDVGGLSSNRKYMIKELGGSLANGSSGSEEVGGSWVRCRRGEGCSVGGGVYLVDCVLWLCE